jgi:hypothetical protein
MQIVRQRKVLQKHASRSTSFRFFAIGLILVGEMTVSFTGGLIVGNPWLPNYLVDRINGRSRDVANANVKAPPAPGTAVEYLNLMNYDEKALTPAERSVAAILNETVAHLDLRKPPFQIFSEKVLPKIETVQPGEDLTKIRAAVQQCRDIADSAVHYYQDVTAPFRAAFAWFSASIAKSLLTANSCARQIEAPTIAVNTAMIPTATIPP